MNRISAIALLTIGSLTACAGAFAQELKANIPFDFIIGNTTMPAGEYMITSPVRDFVEVRNVNYKSVAIAAGNQSYSQSKASGGQLVFTRYGDQYFLDHVLCSTDGALNLDVASGKAEKKAHARALEAKLANDGQKTLVAMR